MNYYLPTRVITGPNAVANSAEKLSAYGRRCLIVTSASAAKRCGALDDVTAALDSQGVTYEIFDAVKPNPSIASCIEGGHMAHELGAEFILGIGGGSPLDAAKVVAISAANPELDAAGLYSMVWPRIPLPIVLVGTTAGTGSEVTQIAVITNTEGRKQSFRDERLYAGLALGDARYTSSMPAAVTASTGTDALAHCIESYLAKNANDFSRAVALQGVSQLIAPLRSIAAGNTPTAGEREALYHGSLLGGMAISVTGTILPHNLGYYLTESHGVPHGFACAVYLPDLLRHAGAAAPERVQRLCRAADAGLEELIDLITSLTPPLKAALSAREIAALLPRWENVAAVNNTVGGVTSSEIEEILRRHLLQ